MGSGAVGDHGDSGTELLNFERYHEVTKGWYDLFYNVGCDTEGFTYEGRDWTIPSQSDLKGWLTFLVVLGQNDRPTKQELDRIKFRILQFWHAIDPNTHSRSLRYHGERASTGCPGPQIKKIVEDLRYDAENENLVVPATGVNTNMYMFQLPNGKYRVVLPGIGYTDVTDPSHWKGVILAGQASGVYTSPHMSALLDPSRMVTPVGELEEFVSTAVVSTGSTDTSALEAKIDALAVQVSKSRKITGTVA